MDCILKGNQGRGKGYVGYAIVYSPYIKEPPKSRTLICKAQNLLGSYYKIAHVEDGLLFQFYRDLVISFLTTSTLILNIQHEVALGIVYLVSLSILDKHQTSMWQTHIL